MKILYTAEVTVHGGREGEAQSSDGHLIVHLSVPEEMGGEGGQGTNPEQLFAAGYAACFQSALMQVARRQHMDAGPSTITAKVGIGPTGRGGFGLEVELHISIPDVDKATKYNHITFAGLYTLCEQLPSRRSCLIVLSEKLVELADQVCPYSNATRGNIPVKLILEEQSLP